MMKPKTDYECDDFEEGFNIYADNSKAFQYEYEMSHYRKYGLLPADNVIIDYIEIINGNWMIVHQDNRPQD